MSMTDKEIYSVSEVAKLKGKSRQTIHQLIRTREVKVERVGKIMVIHKNELHKFD